MIEFQEEDGRVVHGEFFAHSDQSSTIYVSNQTGPGSTMKWSLKRKGRPMDISGIVGDMDDMGDEELADLTREIVKLVLGKIAVVAGAIDAAEVGAAIGAVGGRLGDIVAAAILDHRADEAWYKVLDLRVTGRARTLALYERHGFTRGEAIAFMLDDAAKFAKAIDNAVAQSRAAK